MHEMMSDNPQYQAGAQAAREGWPQISNPYRRGSEKHTNWYLGWLAVTHRGEKIAPPPQLSSKPPKDTMHRRRIFKILEDIPGTKRTGFRKAVESALEDDILQNPELDYCYLLDLRESIERGDVSVVPDVYKIDAATKTVTVWEVEDTYRYRPGKYYDVFWLLDEFWWTLEVIRVDAHSGGTSQVEVFKDVWEAARSTHADA